MAAVTTEGAALVCAVYVRGAVKSQDGSLEKQLQVCRDAIMKRSWVISESHVYVDMGVSGASGNKRLGLNALLNAAATIPSPFRCVVVASEDRLSRNAGGVLNVLDRLSDLGITVFVANMGLHAHDVAYRLYNAIALEKIMQREG